jgi:hypothetical protein
MKFDLPKLSDFIGDTKARGVCARQGRRISPAAFATAA